MVITVVNKILPILFTCSQSFSILFYGVAGEIKMFHVRKQFFGENEVKTVPNLLWLTMGCWLVLLGLLVLLVRRRLRQQRGPASEWRPDWRPDWRPLAADGVAGRWVLAAAVEEVVVLLRLLLRLGAAPPEFSSSGAAVFRSCGTFEALKWGKGR